MRQPWIRQSRTWLTTHWLVTLWLLVAAILLVVTAMASPESFRSAAELTDLPATDREHLRASLKELNLTPRSIAYFQLCMLIVTTIPQAVIGWLLVTKAPSRFAGYLAFTMLAGMAAQYPPSISDILSGHPIAQIIARLATTIGIGGFFILPLIFPTGRFVPRWTIIIGIYLVATVATFAFFPDASPYGAGSPLIEAATSILIVLIAFGSMIYRYRRVSTPQQRRQTRWVMFGLMVGLPGFFLGDAMMRTISGSPIGVVCLIGFLIFMPLMSIVPNITIGLSMLYHGLFDIDVILSRTVVWVAMSAIVTGVYVGFVLGVGAILNIHGSLILSIIATGLVAVGFQPLRLRVQDLTNRFLFGERDNPYAVLSRLGHHIEDSLSSADLLPAIVRTTADMLRLPYVALFLERPDGPVLVASSGVAAASTLRLPLMYQGKTVGSLDVAPRSPGEVFGQADRRILEDLARQIGVAARTVSLADDLQHSRERIVISREEERRRLRRDLHDGLGAQLAALIMQAGVARSHLRTDPDAADQELVELRQELRSAVADIRRLVYGLRPPALDELGLVGALRTRLERLDRGGIEADSPALQIDFVANDTLPPLSAAVEVATFRIVEEAVTNVVKHAQATHAIVTLRVETDQVLIEVSDNGIGLPPVVASSGLGVQSMRERATEIGGSCTVTTNPTGHGTLVRVAVPVVSAALHDARMGVGERWTAPSNDSAS